MEKKPQSIYEPIENYGIIGNLQTVALVSKHASIDFMCYPRFDTPSVFCKLLDSEKGGCFSITPHMKGMISKQLYLPDTNVLLTRFFAEEGIAEIIDFMPVGNQGRSGSIIRKIKTVRGRISYNITCAPRFNYANTKHKAVTLANGISFQPEGTDQPPLFLYSNMPHEVKGNDLITSFDLSEGETAYYILGPEMEAIDNTLQYAGHINSSYQDTIHFWQSWIAQSNYKGRWQEVVNRSALTLKLLISHEFGSMVAAPTFSLPEAIGEGRNWDYRYTWIRDAAFSMHAFLQLGFTEEAEAFLKWLKKQTINKELQLMFSIDGHTLLEEKELPELEGYKGSKPVRIGNNAYKQTQMDIYGELMETLYVYSVHGGDITYDFWQTIEQYVNFICDNWERPDHSIWEVRGEKREFLFSRLMCWVAMDRAIKIAQRFSFPFNFLKWHQVRDEIYKNIYEQFWDEGINAFVQYKGSQTIDASALLMPILNIISPFSAKWKSTMEAIENQLRSDVLVYRYKEQRSEIDGLKGTEGTFSMCSFWFVECLAQAGRIEEAKEQFEKMLGYANHLGLFAEQIGKRGEHLGNFPQAFTHLALISAAIELTKVERKSSTELLAFNKSMK